MTNEEKDAREQAEAPRSGSGGEASRPAGASAAEPAPEQGLAAFTEEYGTPDPVGDGGLKDQVIDQLRTVYDPEIPVNIHALGLIYGVKIDEQGHCKVTMTLTSPHCPAAATLPGEVEAKVRSVPGITGAEINLVWNPPWTPDLMTPEARLTLGL